MGGKTKPPYPVQFREQILELYATGRSKAELAKEFGCAQETISNWVKRAARLSALPDRGTPVRRAHRQARELAQDTALSEAERAELEQLRKEVRRLQVERDILAKATAWFASEGTHGTKGSTR
jgi:transposase